MNKDDSVLGLAEIRRNRGISLQQIAESTKISVRSLEAIEQGDFRRLPGGIYNTSYIRQYARAIDYDESVLIAFYHQQTGSPKDAAPVQPSAGGHYRTAHSIFNW
jgi:cytoskeletal protein RodZ